MLMEKNSASYTSHLGLGIALSLGLFASSVYVGTTIFRLKAADKTIEVKGFSEKKITSDIAVWSGNLIARSTSLTEAFSKLENDKKQVIGFFTGEDIKAEQVTTDPITKDTIFKLDERGHSTNIPESYILRQKFTVTSNDVHKIAALAVKIDQLNTQGIEFESARPDFFFSSDKLNQVKVNLLGEATKSASERAHQLATNSGSGVGKLVSARQGIFQVTPENSTDLSDYGVYDTSTIEKVVKIVVTLSYTIN